jgi:hypothetical protein
MSAQHELGTCKNCSAFERLPDEMRQPGAGNCRRSPPTGFAIPTKMVMQNGQQDLQIASAWPPVREGEWCMAFVPNVETAKIMHEERQKMLQGMSERGVENSS